MRRWRVRRWSAARFLTEACEGDDVLRQEVESLLAYESASARFLETPRPTS